MAGGHGHFLHLVQPGHGGGDLEAAGWVTGSGRAIVNGRELESFEAKEMLGYQHIARIYEVFPLLCQLCGGQMRIIAFIAHSANIRQMLDHLGVQAEPPNISPSRGPSLREDCEVQIGEGVEVEPGWDLVAQSAPDFDVDQRVN
jgi:hypothetical protein